MSHNEHNATVYCAWKITKCLYWLANKIGRNWYQYLPEQQSHHHHFPRYGHNVDPGVRRDGKIEKIWRGADVQVFNDDIVIMFGNDDENHQKSIVVRWKVAYTFNFTNEAPGEQGMPAEATKCNQTTKTKKQ